MSGEIKQERFGFGFHFVEKVLRLFYRTKSFLAFSKSLGNLCLFLVGLATVSSSGDVGWAKTYQEAEEDAATDDDRLFVCDFSDTCDINYDLWPDHWRRQSGFGFPKYSELKIKPAPDAKGSAVMEIALDGGQAAMYSPKVKVGQQYSYVLKLRAKLEDREGHHCKAWASIEFFDKDDNKVSSFPFQTIQESNRWLEVTTPLLALDHPSITHAVIGLHVQPLEETSLFGRALFDDVVLYQRPRIVLETGQPLNVFTDAKQVQLSCHVSGARRKDAGLQIELFDEHGKLLRSNLQSLMPSMTPGKVLMNADGTFQNFAVKHLLWKLTDGEASDPDVDYRGFYRLRITLLDREASQLVSEITFVVVEPTEAGPQTLFGWTLNRSIYDIDSTVLSNTLQQLGVNWIKLPVWIDPQDPSALEMLGTLLQKISRHDIDVVGVFDEPPSTTYEKYWQHEQGMAALTTDIQTFQDAIEPVMTQFSLRIGSWQVGSDSDTSIAEDLSHIEKMDKMKLFFAKYGEDVKVGLPWTWLLQRIPDSKQTWDFTSIVAYPELTTGELEHYAGDFATDSGKEQYISLQPLPVANYSLLTRVRDLTQRIIEVKRLNITRVFVPEPLKPQAGFFLENDMPTEILLPWRTLATKLNGATYLGKIRLPNASENYLFARDGKALMILWNDQTVTEELFLGTDIRVVDLWGRKVDFQAAENRQQIQVGSWPFVVENMDLEVAQIRQSIAFDREAIDSVLGQRQPLKLGFLNGFARGVSGNLTLYNETLFAPEYTLPFKAAKAEQFEYTIPLQVRQDALTGKQLIRFDFKFHNEDMVPFSAWHPLTIGLDDIEFATREMMEENGQFTVKVTLINRGEGPVTYVVYLLVPGRKRLSVQFHDVMPGQHSKNLVLQRALNLKGETLWMRARDGRGARSLNYKIVVE